MCIFHIIQIISTHINDTIIFYNKTDILSPLTFAFNRIGYFIIFALQRLTKGNMINNKKMDCQPYRKRRPAVKRAAFLRDRERRKTYKETGPK